jgi:hypothetical protein
MNTINMIRIIGNAAGVMIAEQPFEAVGSSAATESFVLPEGFRVTRGELGLELLDAGDDLCALSTDSSGNVFIHAADRRSGEPVKIKLERA